MVFFSLYKGVKTNENELKTSPKQRFVKYRSEVTAYNEAAANSDTVQTEDLVSVATDLSLAMTKLQYVYYGIDYDIQY